MLRCCSTPQGQGERNQYSDQATGLMTAESWFYSRNWQDISVFCNRPDRRWESPSLLFNWHQGLFLQQQSRQIAALTNPLYAGQVFKVSEAICTRHPAILTGTGLTLLDFLLPQCGSRNPDGRSPHFTGEFLAHLLRFEGFRHQTSVQEYKYSSLTFFVVSLSYSTKMSGDSTG